MRDTVNRRASNRTYPLKTKNIVINEKLFILNDISREGIGVRMETSSDFSLGQRIASISLENHADAPLLVGIVNHMSQNDFGTVCGIRFEFRNSIEFDYVEKIRRELAMT
jgi:hypothetical protein